MATDPKKNTIDGRVRAITIHDGARLTPALVRMLDVLVDEATEHLGEKTRTTATGYDLERVDPIIVGRSDGIAIYVSRTRRIL